ncbi:MAG: 6-phosphogluconolactonase [Myxococcota bacterium]
MAATIQVARDVGPAAAERVVAALEAAVAARGRATLAVPGGTGPIPVFDAFVASFPAALAARTVLTWVDERHGAAEGPDWAGWSADSNRRLVWERWLSRVETRPREVPLDAPGSLAEARAAVEARWLAEVGALDVALLGVGPDGHVASLFPGHPLASAPGTVLAVADAPKPPPERLTLSRGVLEAAGCVVVVATGAAKAPVLAARDPATPIGGLSPRGAYWWVLDPAAAG